MQNRDDLNIEELVQAKNLCSLDKYFDQAQKENHLRTKFISKTLTLYLKNAHKTKSKYDVLKVS